MDLSFDDTQQAIIELAATVFGKEVDDARVKRIEATPDAVDRELWATLAATGLVAVTVPESHGGSGGGLTEAACVIEQQGRCLGTVPLASTLGGAWLLARLGPEPLAERWLGRVAAGDATLGWSTGVPHRALGTPPVQARPDGAGWRLDGTVHNVAYATTTDAVLVPARLPDGSGGVFLVETGPTARPAVELVPTRVSDRLARAHVELRGAPVERVGGDGASSWLAAAQRIGLGALAVGVADGALRRAAVYTSERRQFGKPLASFQSTAHHAANAYIDVAAMRATLWQAASLVDENLDAAAALLAATVAGWWAADATPRVVTTVQHLHGGLGADIDYPIHRYFLWGIQIEHDLGGAAAVLADLGERVAAPTGAQPTEETFR